jgi:hydroxymethylpyrimidine/phosphomethylpyrimidine kinase
MAGSRSARTNAVAGARPPCVLSIAGSDSGGGAGIQADLKAFAACGAHGLTAITAITAQNTVGVSAVQAISPEVIVAQVKAVAEDIGVDAVKIGMLGTVATIEAVAASLDLLAPGTPVVLDPVMVSESGAELLEPSARGALLEFLLPRVLVITPNLPEARALAAAGTGSAAAAAATGFTAPPTPAQPDHGGDDAAELARALRALGPEIVVVTGGHREQAVDVFFDGSQVVELPGERYPGGAAHGSGCTHSSVLAARLAWGDTPLEAARVAKSMAARAVRDGLAGVGAGAGPVNILGVT